MCELNITYNNEKRETTLSPKDTVSVEIMKVDWDLCWGESRSSKPCVFPCRVPAAGDERYVVCVAVAGAIVSTSNRFLLCVLQRVVVHVCAVL